MPEAYIVAALRTAGGRRKGRLANVHPADLAASVLNALIERSDIDPAMIEADHVRRGRPLQRHDCRASLMLFSHCE